VLWICSHLPCNKKSYKSGWQFLSTNIYTVLIIHLQLKHMEADYAVKICLKMWLSHLETWLQITESLLYISGLHCFWTAKIIKEQVLTIFMNHIWTERLLRVITNIVTVHATWKATFSMYILHSEFQKSEQNVCLLLM
jgi:hypothetical protein